MRAFIVGLLVLSTATACTEPPAPAPPPPPPSASPAPLTPPYEPEALMAAVSAAVKRVDGDADIRPGEIDTSEGWTGISPCDLTIADPVWDRTLDFEGIWASGIEVNPVPSFYDVQQPTIFLDIRVIHLPDPRAADSAARQVAATKCPTDDFHLKIGLATARRAQRTVRLESTSAQVTSATVQRLNPESEHVVTYLPGEVRLTFAHGPLLISVDALALQPRRAHTPAEVTAIAQKRAIAVGVEILQALS
ncbi:MAG TPA: hypothetical protein VFX61_22705 [Micromonosporaceae bacterium]|nr:hypothetical protein [Micromonosporaceae bacterium]